MKTGTEPLDPLLEALAARGDRRDRVRAYKRNESFRLL